MIWSKRDNFVFWVKIVHFIIENKGKRKCFLKHPPPPVKQKILLRGFNYCYLAYFYQRVCCFTGGNMSTDRNTFQKKNFAF